VWTIRRTTDAGIEHRLDYGTAEPMKPQSPWIPDDM
jgi:hypothetical protein